MPSQPSPRPDQTPGDLGLAVCLLVGWAREARARNQDKPADDPRGKDAPQPQPAEQEPAHG